NAEIVRLGAKPILTNATTRGVVHSVVTWRGGQGDKRWSNPANWEGGVVPGASDVARLTKDSSADAVVDADSIGGVAGLEVDRDYLGTLALGRDLAVSGEVKIAGGAVDQREYSFTAYRYSQSGGTFTGGAAPLVIEADANVSGGML